MPEMGTREEWQAARDELAKLDAEHATLGQKVTEQRRRLPWVRVEKEYEFDTRTARRPWPISSTSARSCSPPTSCSVPIRTSPHALGARTSATSCAPRGCT